MTREEFIKLTANDVIVLNDEPIEGHKSYSYWGAGVDIISDMRKKYPKGTKFQINNCAEVEENWFMILFFTDGVVSKNTFDRPCGAISENLCVFFDKIN